MHWDHDERQIDGWDEYLDARQVRADTAADESSLPRLVAECGTALGYTRNGTTWSALGRGSRHFPTDQDQAHGRSVTSRETAVMPLIERYPA